MEREEMTALPSHWTLYRYNKNDFDSLAKKGEEEYSRVLEPYVKVCRLDTLNSVVYALRLLSQRITVGKGGYASPAENPSTVLRNINLHNFVIMRGDILPVWEVEENRGGGTLSLVTDADGGFELFQSLLCLTVGQTLVSEEHTSRITGLSVSYLNSRKTGQQSYYMKIWDGGKCEGVRNLDTFCSILTPESRKVLGNTSMRYITHNEKRNYNRQILKDILFCDTGCYSKKGQNTRSSRRRNDPRPPRR